MEKIETYFSGQNNLHHFLLVEGFIDETFEYLGEVLAQNFGLSQHDGNLTFQKFEKFLVNDANWLRDLSMHKIKVGERRVHVFGFSIFSDQAQNVILKALEEPSVGNHFVFVVPSLNNILDTVRSRAVLIDAKSLFGEDELVHKIRKMNFAERGKWVAKILKQIENEELSRNFVPELNKKIILELKKTGAEPDLILNFVNLSKNLTSSNIALKPTLDAMMCLL